VDIHVGNRIKMQRRLSGKSQTELGKGIGVTFQQVQKYENCTNRVSSSRLQRIASLLNVGASFFFEGIEGADGSPAADHLVIYATRPAGSHWQGRFSG